MTKAGFKLRRGLVVALIIALVEGLLAAGGMVAYPRPVGAAATNLALNGSFETSGAPAANWSAWSPASGYAASRDGAEAHIGDYALKITANAGVRPTVYQTMNVVAGQKYKVSAWIKTNDATNAGAGLQYVFKNADNQEIYTNNTAYYTATAPGSNGAWGLTEAVMTAPAGAAKIVISNYYLGRADDQGAAWFDDVQFGEWTSATGVTLNTNAATLAVGGTLQLTATVAPANASNPNVVWTSSNAGAASVDGSGIVTGIGNGTTTITASTADGGFTASAVLTVGSGDPVAVVNLVQNGSFETAGAPAANWTGGTAANWTLWQGPSPAYSGAFGATLDTAVHKAGLQSLKLTAASTARVVTSQSVPVVDGKTYKYSAWVRTSDSSNAAAGIEYVFHSGAGDSPIDIGGTKYFEVSAQGARDENNWTQIERIVQAPAQAVRVGLSNTYKGTGTGEAWFDGIVLEEWNAVAGVALDTNASDLALGQTSLMHAAVAPANANNPSVQWSSSDPSVATVDASGQVTAVGKGLALITATTVEGGYQAYSSVRVDSGANITVPNYAENTRNGVAVNGQVEAVDANEGALTYRLLVPAAHGSALVKSDGTWTYAPTPGYSGNDRFTVGALDAQGNSAISTVTIAVEDLAETLQAYAGVHARLLLDGAKIAQLRTAIQPGGTHAALWSEYRQSVTIAAAPTYYASSDQEELWQRDVAARMVDYAFTYLLTEDAAYKNAAIAWATTAAAYPTWGRNGEVTDVSLAAGHLLFGLAVVYDWLYDDLSESDRTVIREALKTHGEEVYNKAIGHNTAKVWWASVPAHNIMHVLVSGLAAASLAIYDEEPEAVDWFGYSLSAFAAIEDWMPADGASYEGFAYWQYSMEWTIKFAKLAEKFVGSAILQNDFYKNSSKYVAYSMLSENGWTPTGSFLNLADNEGYNYYGPDYLMRVIAAENRDGLAQWMADRIDSKNVGNSASRWLGILYYDPTVAATPVSAQPTLHLFDNLGLAVSRSDWSGDESIVAFKSGPPMGHKDLSMDGFFGGGHQHPDANHFLVYANGEYLIRDDGYADKLTSNHNTLLVNEIGQIGEGGTWFDSVASKTARSDADILKAESNPTFDYMVGEAAGTYPADLGLEKYERHLIFLKPNLLIVVDDIETSQPQNLELRFFPEQQGVQTLANGDYLVTSARSALRFQELTASEAQVKAEKVHYDSEKFNGDRMAFRVLGEGKTSMRNAVAFSWGGNEALPANVSLVQNGDKWTFESGSVAVELDLAARTVTEVESTGGGTSESDAGLASILVNGAAIAGFSPDTLTYDVEYASNKPIPTMTWLSRSTAAAVQLDYDGAVPGTAVLRVTAGDGTERTYTVHIHSSRLLPIYGVTANGVSSNGPGGNGFGPENAYDENAGSIWSDSVNAAYAEYPPGYAYAQFDLSKVRTVNEVGILWYQGLGRHYLFDVETSVDGVHWTRVIDEGQSSGLTAETEKYAFDDVQARYIRIIGKGRTGSAFFSISEVYFYQPSVSVPKNEAAVTLSVQDKVYAGQNFNVAVGLQNLPDSIYASAMTIRYDEERVAFVAAAAAQAGLAVYANADTPGELRLLIANADEDAVVTNRASLADLTFRALETDAASTTSLEAVEASISDAAREWAATGGSATVSLATVNKSGLQALLAAAANRLAAATEVGAFIGQYSASAKSALQSAIGSAGEVYADSSAAPADVEQAIADLSAKLAALKASVKTLDAASWSVGDLAVISKYYGKSSSDPEWSLYLALGIAGGRAIGDADLAAVAAKLMQR
ncbi:Ig-like domain-containing protein [Cohnella sp. GCM10020058]|uniref:Ig-like domain-containing protein n=1 Tax=Cohnella sp. GCM10020058 TaxID=3317330 RepID=UPI00363070EE